MKGYLGFGSVAHAAEVGAPIQAREVAAPVFPSGYGRDPQLVDPQSAPWRSTLTPTQRSLLKPLVDTILPADGGAPEASALKIDNKLDEWLSAPYPNQVADAEVALPLLDALGERDFASLDATDRDDLLTTLSEEGFGVDTVVQLVAGLYFTTDQGAALAGFVGNEPRAVFEGPPSETIALLEERLDAL